MLIFGHHTYLLNDQVGVEGTLGNQVLPGARVCTDCFCKLGSCVLDNTVVDEVLNPSKENITNSLLQPSCFFAVHAQ